MIVDVRECLEIAIVSRAPW